MLREGAGGHRVGAPVHVGASGAPSFLLVVARRAALGPWSDVRLQAVARHASAHPPRFALALFARKLGGDAPRRLFRRRLI